MQFYTLKNIQMPTEEQQPFSYIQIQTWIMEIKNKQSKAVLKLLNKLNRKEIVLVEFKVILFLKMGGTEYSRRNKWGEAQLTSTKWIVPRKATLENKT